MIGGTTLLSRTISAIPNLSPDPSLPLFPDPTPLSQPLVILTSGVFTLYPPASSSTVTLKNVGAPCTANMVHAGRTFLKQLMTAMEHPSEKPEIAVAG